MPVAVVGGGIVGLFTAYHLEQQGADVTLYEPGEPGAGSVHAAGIIEPTTAYRTNTLAFLRRLWRFWERGTTTYRSADPAWLLESVRQLGRPGPAGWEATLARFGDACVEQYRSLAGEANDFEYTLGGLAERYDDPAHFAEARAEALDRADRVPVEVQSESGGAGTLVFPEVGWLHTHRFARWIVGRLRRTTIVRAPVQSVRTDGTVTVADRSERFDAVVAATGTSCRRLGVPLTGVRGYGWTVDGAGAPVRRATIHVDRGIAVVPYRAELKVTAGWDFDLADGGWHVPAVQRAVLDVLPGATLGALQQGSRPCTPDGLPTVGRRDALVVATGGFRLGWSFGPELGRHAALLALGRAGNDPFLARFCGALRSGTL